MLTTQFSDRTIPLAALLKSLGGAGSFPALLPTLGGPCPHTPDHRIEFSMGHPPTIQHETPTGLDHPVDLLPTRRDPGIPAALPARSESRAPAAPQSRVKQHALGPVVILEVACRLSDAVQELNEAIQLALAGEPRGLVCELVDLLEDSEPASLEMLATAGRHVRDWPGIAVAVSCQDPQVREALHVHPLGAHLIVTQSLLTAITAVQTGPTLDVQRLQLTPHPSAPRAARDFVTRTLLDWQLSRVIPFASLVVSELVASSSLYAGTDIDLSVVWDRGALRLTVADRAQALPGQSQANLKLDGRARTVLAGLTRGFGVLPTTGGGKVVWAVLEAPRRNHSAARTLTQQQVPARHTPAVGHRSTG